MMKVYPVGIKNARESANFTQELLAEYSGISVRTLQNVESEKGCKLDTLKDISAVLDIHFNEFIPKPTEITFKASWYRLTKDLFYYLAYRPTVNTVLFILVVLGAFFSIYIAESFGLITYDNTASSISLPNHFTESRSSAISTQELVGVFWFIFALIWFLAMFIQNFNLVERSRDYNELVTKPLDNFFCKVWLSLKNFKSGIHL